MSRKIRGAFHTSPGNHVSRALWRVYRIGSMVTGPEGWRRAAVRAASISVGNDSASFSGPQATDGTCIRTQSIIARAPQPGKIPTLVHKPLVRHVLLCLSPRTCCRRDYHGSHCRVSSTFPRRCTEITARTGTIRTRGRLLGAVTRALLDATL
jgi:hypothetical protein